MVAPVVFGKMISEPALDRVAVPESVRVLVEMVMAPEELKTLSAIVMTSPTSEIAPVLVSRLWLIDRAPPAINVNCASVVEIGLSITTEPPDPPDRRMIELVNV